jgi:gag-polypeptide of LTR copia-type
MASIKKVWNTLKRVYEEHSKALIVDIMQHFHNKCCKKTESICTHFETLTDLQEQLAAMDKAIGDEDYTDTLLASLPAFYNSAVSSISASAHLGSTFLTTEIFEQLIIDKYEHQQVKDKCSMTKDEALSADSSKKKGKDKKNMECFNCCKKEHYKSKCHAPGGGQEGKGPKQGKGAKNDATPAEEEVLEAWATIQYSQEPNAAVHAPLLVELYDSGASHHMSPSCDCFKSY